MSAFSGYLLLGGGVAAYSAEVLADDPEVYWQCQESSGAFIDSSGNGLDSNGVTNAGDLTYGLPGPCGDDVAVEWAGAAGSPTGRFRNAKPFAAVDNITLEMWFWPITLPASALLWFIGDGTGDGFGIGAVSTTTVRGVVPGIANMASFTNTPPASAWSHLAIVRRSGTWEYYFDGAVDNASVSSAAPNNATAQTWNGFLFAGANYRCAHLAAYDTALSADRIAAHYEAASATQIGEFV